MSDTTTRGATNGIAAALDHQRYRPQPSTTKVQDEVLRSLASVITEAFDNARNLVSLAEHYDRDASTATRYGHLVDAAECAEIAMTHLGQLKAAMNHRLHIEDERLGEPQF